MNGQSVSRSVSKVCIDRELPGQPKMLTKSLKTNDIKTLEVKLVGGSGPHEGNIFVGGLPVCDDKHDKENAVVVCRCQIY